MTLPTYTSPASGALGHSRGLGPPRDESSSHGHCLKYRRQELEGKPLLATYTTSTCFKTGAEPPGSQHHYEPLELQLAPTHGPSLRAGALPSNQRLFHPRWKLPRTHLQATPDTEECQADFPTPADSYLHLLLLPTPPGQGVGMRAYSLSGQGNLWAKLSRSLQTKLAG